MKLCRTGKSAKSDNGMSDRLIDVVMVLRTTYYRTTYRSTVYRARLACAQKLLSSMFHFVQFPLIGNAKTK